MADKFRLITRSDFDGLACAMILRELDLIDEIKFVHPKDMQDGLIPVTDRDISTNLPYAPGIHLAFDHHSSEEERGVRHENYINEADADSTARVLYHYYGGKAMLPGISEELLAAVDRADSAKYTLAEILRPEGWVLLSYLMDARTGLGRFKTFRISNYDLMMQLIDYCRDHTVDEVLALPDVRERVDLYFEQQELFRAQIERVHYRAGDVIVLPLRDEETIYAGNRFYVYALYPEAKISVHVMWGLRKQNTAITIGKSIIDRSSNVDIGAICASFGGGGHKNAGTCQVENDAVERVLPVILERLNAG